MYHMLNDGISPKSKHPHSAITNSPEIRSHDSAITKMKTPTFCNHKQPRNSVTRFCNHQNQNTHILQSPTEKSTTQFDPPPKTPYTNKIKAIKHPLKNPRSIFISSFKKSKSTTTHTHPKQTKTQMGKLKSHPQKNR
jgi:hypothetical protein